MNCKPGDLAIVMHSAASPKLVGRVVEVVRAVQPPESLRMVDGTTFFLEIMPGTAAWIVRSERPLPIQVGIYHVGFAYETGVRDAYLLPINGVPVNDEVTDEVTA